MKKFLYFTIFLFLAINLYGLTDFKIKLFPKSIYYGPQLKISDEFVVFELKNDTIYFYYESDSEPLSKEELQDIYDYGSEEIYKIRPYGNRYILCSVEDSEKIIGELFSDKLGELSVSISSCETSERMIFVLDTVKKRFLSYSFLVAGILEESIVKNFEDNSYEYRQYDYMYSEPPEEIHPLDREYRCNSIILDADLKCLNQIEDLGISKSFVRMEYDGEFNAKKLIIRQLKVGEDKEIANGFYLETVQIKELKNADLKRWEVSESFYNVYDINMNLLISK